MVKNNEIKNALSLLLVAILCFTMLGIKIGAQDYKYDGGKLEVVIGEDSSSSSSSSSSRSSSPSSTVEVPEKTTSNIVKLPATGSNNLLTLTFLAISGLFLSMHFLSKHIDKIKEKTVGTRSDVDENN